MNDGSLYGPIAHEEDVWDWNDIRKRRRLRCKVKEKPILFIGFERDPKPTRKVKTTSQVPQDPQETKPKTDSAVESSSDSDKGGRGAGESEGMLFNLPLPAGWQEVLENALVGKPDAVDLMVRAFGQAWMDRVPDDLKRQTEAQRNYQAQCAMEERARLLYSGH